MIHVASSETEQATAETRLRAVAIAVATDVPIEVVVEVGDPAEVLLAQARAMDATAIAVAACSHTMLHRELLGSVARKIALDSDRAVLILPPA